jgi:hypothetical protein
MSTPGLAPTAGTKTAWRSSATVSGGLYLALSFRDGVDPILKERIPPRAVTADYASVVIWCDRFDVAFSAADII